MHRKPIKAPVYTPRELSKMSISQLEVIAKNQFYMYPDLFADGRELYSEYLSIPGAAATLNPEAWVIAEVSTRLDLTKSYVRKDIDEFLWQ